MSGFPGSTSANVSTLAKRTEPYGAVRGSLMAPILPHSRSRIERSRQLHGDVPADSPGGRAAPRRVIHRARGLVSDVGNDPPTARSSKEPSALFLAASPEPRHQAAQPAPDVVAGVSSDP